MNSTYFLFSGFDQTPRLGILILLSPPIRASIHPEYRYPRRSILCDQDIFPSSFIALFLFPCLIFSDVVPVFNQDLFSSPSYLDPCSTGLYAARSQPDNWGIPRSSLVFLRWDIRFYPTDDAAKAVGESLSA
ncbi:unnamed protein product [Aspergillus oryzae RIB40]|uniref:DNA, SC005 n=1 Tax=Aspergillus oryzae (strain ATCC 42149 / RIB 40) TaxID=510516 RepID=Q2UQZ6_ASPOR|nr:unnamed protein product [Aspergillus oryzae RIB40]BAE56019.1 unnamed protein product [Aspergillus oryzae RIB40]